MLQLSSFYFMRLVSIAIVPNCKLTFTNTSGDGDRSSLQQSVTTDAGFE